MLDMPRPRPPYLHKLTSRHGKTVWCVQVGRGPRIRIRGEFGTPEFQRAYEEAVTADRPAPEKPVTESKGTLAWLWMLYRQTGAWTGLKAPTRKQRENIMLHVLKAAGDKPVSAINRASIIAAVERRSATPFQAKNYLTTMRGLFGWAASKNVVRFDPTAGVKVFKPKTKGFPIWTEEDVDRYEARWPLGTRERVMLDVFIYTGLRRGDAAMLGKQHVRNGVITIDTEKTDTRVTIPLLPVLQRTLDAGPIGELAFIATRTGQPMTKESVGNTFAEACKAAGITGKSAHGLRKAAATRAADNGATVAELEAIFGWQGGRMAALYTEAANRRKLAARAMGKLAKP
jgi:integrase